MTNGTKSKPGKTGKRGTPKVTNFVKKTEAETFAEILKEQNSMLNVEMADAEGTGEETDLYIIHDRGSSEQVISNSNEKERLRSLWLHEKDVDKALWRKIKFNVPVQNPVTEEVSFESILKRIKEEKNNGVLHDHSIMQKLDHSLWKVGTKVTVPPSVADYYVNLKYDMGFEGMGNVTTVDLGRPIERKYLHVAEYIDRIGG